MTTFSWESPEGIISREWVSDRLGLEWADAWEFYGRMVSHMSLEAAPHGDLGMHAAEGLRERIRAQIPAGLDEVLPFAVRYLWNHSLDTLARREFLARLQQVSRLSGGSWDIDELTRRVDEVMSV